MTGMYQIDHANLDVSRRIPEETHGKLGDMPYLDVDIHPSRCDYRVSALQ